MSTETDLLRAAATHLRDMADAATPTPWHIDPDTPSVVRGGPMSMVVVEGWAPDTRLAALMGDPDMARDLADWLEDSATAIYDYGGYVYVDERALAIARRIMREPSHETHPEPPAPATRSGLLHAQEDA